MTLCLLAFTVYILGMMTLCLLDFMVYLLGMMFYILFFYPSLHITGHMGIGHILQATNTGSMISEADGERGGRDEMG